MFILPRLKMNYNFLKKCVESRHYDPINPKCIESILDRVSPKLKGNLGTHSLHLQKLCSEVVNEYRATLVEHTGIPDSLILPFSEPRHDSFLKCRRMIKAHLHLLHPEMQAVLDIGYKTFNQLILTDLSTCRASGPVECESLLSKAVEECQSSEKQIMNTWFPQMIHLLTSKKITKRVKVDKLDSFYNSASTLISNQLKSLIQTNVERFVGLFDPDNPHCLPIFRMALTFDEQKMEINPTAQDLENSVLNILSTIVNTMQKVPTVQSWLANSSSPSVNASLPKHILDWAMVTVKNTVHKHLEEPNKHLQSYGDAPRLLQASTHRFILLLIFEIETFQSVSKEIKSLPSKGFFPMVHLDCAALKQGLANKAKSYAEIFVKKLVSELREQNQLICSEFEAIQRKAREIPENTDDIAQIEEYMKFVKTKGIGDLTEKIKVIMQIETCVFRLLISSFIFCITITKPFALSPFEQYVAHVSSTENVLQEAEEAVALINKEEAFYKLDLTSYPEIDVFKENMEPYQKLFRFNLKWKLAEKSWMGGNFLKLDGESISVQVDEFYREIFKMLKFFQQKQVKAAQEVENISGRTNYVPVLSIVCNPGIKDRHWDQMSKVVGQNIAPKANTTLQEFLKQDLTPYLKEFESITAVASKEFSLEKTMQTMVHIWDDVSFQHQPYRETGVSILTAVDDIQTMLDDQIVKIQTMRGSPFILPFESQIKKWEGHLLQIHETIDEWLKVQAQWLYLEPIFSSQDIMQQIPEEGQLFQTVDRNWKNIMRHCVKNSKVLAATSLPGLLEQLQDSNTLLESIMKGLNAYLEKKRLFFPRFFFLSNDEMLEILSETKDPLRVQPHLKKCFEGISKLDFLPNLDIQAMYSSEGERVELIQHINTSEVKGAVEKWLIQVEDVMVHSIRDAVDRSRVAYAKVPRDQWVKEWPGQVVICTSQIFWTLEVHKAIGAGADGIKKYYQQLQHQLNDIIKLVRGKLAKQTRVTLEALVTIDVHARDVVMELIEKGVSHESDFQWLAQLRYYWSNENVRVHIINCDVKYAYEYLGNSPRLVITPLTDRCYRTLIGAFYLNLGGAPEGPAGTGKTETTKDLAKALAVQCVVFNCSDGLDYLTMGKFFKGLASSGAWACFDEFNRIELEVLSVVAQQVLCIQRAIEQRLEYFDFEGTMLKLNPNCFVSITMNPGYAGRSELPDNLKVLFRTVAMMVPNYALIAEISLYSHGFLNAKPLSVKIVMTYRLCSEQLSSQFHYDYGMRAVKAVLVAAGNLKLKYPNENEDILLLRSIKDVNEPKFLSHDIPLFNGITSDLFPGISLPQADYQLFLEAAEQCCKKQNIQPTQVFLQKMIQTYEMMIVRHGFMLVGEPFAGKTTVLHILADTLTLMKENGYGAEEKVIFRTINPKSITMGQLFGQFDQVSHEWTDGIVANTFREFALADTPDHKWVVFDGPIDTLWIESMNTVLDDNKKLCLMSGEIIQMSTQMSLIFEVMDLSQASPATVSRCGMVYMEPAQLGWKPLVISWMNTLPEVLQSPDKRSLLLELFHWLIPPALTLLRKHCRVSGSKYNFKFAPFCLYFCLQAAFAFSLVWSVGGACDADSREKFSQFLRETISGQRQEYPIPTTIGTWECPLNEKGLVYDYFYEFHGKGQWVHWNETIKDISLGDKNTKVQEIIVPTIDTVRYTYLMDLCIAHGVPPLFVGPTGTGKSVYVKEKLMNNLDKDRFLPFFVNFSARTSANQTQNIIMSRLDKRRKGVFGPPLGKKCVMFVDDMNMPALERFGAQPPVELLRQFIDHGNWYDLKDTSKICLVDIQLISAMGPPGGGRNAVSSRFLRHFNIFSINPFSDDTMVGIFSNIVDFYLKHNMFPPECFAVGTQIVTATMEVYKQAMKNLLPTPAKSHYTFNLRDFSRVIQGCLLLKKDSLENKHTMIRLFVHEVFRVYYDRLVDDRDREWLYKLMNSILENHFNESFEQVFENLKQGSKLVEEDMQSLLFGDYMNPDLEDDERLYAEVPSIDSFAQVAESCLQEYNQMNKNQMNLVIFRYVLEHLSRISRVLKQPGGHALLVGLGGSGRQSITRLAASMAHMTMFQPEISKTYGMTEWRDDLKIHASVFLRAFSICGLMKSRMVLQFSRDFVTSQDEKCERFCSRLASEVLPIGRELLFCYVLLLWAGGKKGLHT
uniref:Dynein axonemal heavy chain 12 n=1 Tax=Nothobranchius furzeri TaxID=105023 RepID=A0A8C6MFN2_NOTFU